MKTIEELIQANGPFITSKIAEWLISEGLSAEAARKRISRCRSPLRTFPVPIFPKKVRFMYLESQRNREHFWLAMQRDLRATRSIYGIALDGLLARRGVVLSKDFPTISGATMRPVSKQVTAESVLQKRKDAGLIIERQSNLGQLVAIGCDDIGSPDIEGMRARDLSERIILDGLREWARKIGAAAYNKIRIRGETELEPIGQFQFDLAGPSYILPLNSRAGKQPGFLVADVFSEGILTPHHICYFIRKAQALHATLNNTSVLPILVAEGFSGEAITLGHSAGILMATPSDLFGSTVGQALKTLLQTLNRAAAYASSETPERIVSLINNLSEIEGRARNLRGPMFELIVAYLVRRDAVSIAMGVRATDSKTGDKADIDVLKYTAQNADCVAIECKGKEPGGKVTELEVGSWLKKIPVMKAYLKARSAESNISFELWTSGEFSTDALTRLKVEKEKRIKNPISWKSGEDVLALATKHREPAMGNALKEHFLRHPLSSI